MWALVAKRVGYHTHAVETPCVLQLVPSPKGGQACCFFLAEVARQLVGNRFCREQGAIKVERNDNLVLFRHSFGARRGPFYVLLELTATIFGDFCHLRSSSKTSLRGRPSFFRGA